MCDALRDSVTFAQFKKCEKHPWRSVTFSKVAGFQTKKVLPKLGYLKSVIHKQSTCMTRSA